MNLMRSLITSAILVCFVSVSFAQTPTFSEDVAPIIFNKCATCHHEGGIAPFPLMSYANTYDYRFSVKNAVETKIMPPWPPDAHYGDFLFERTLTDDEINTIKEWVDGGAPEGNAVMTPEAPVFVPGRTIPNEPDLTISMAPYESQANTSDEYTCFAIPSGLTEDRYIRAIEIVPGNPAVVHHVIVFAADANITDCLMPIIAGQTLTGYAPGAPPTIFPSNGDDFKLGMKLKAGSNIMLQIHYPAGTVGEWDSTSVNFYFYPKGETGIREVNSGPYVQNFLFPTIQPNTTQRIEGYYPYIPGTTTQGDMSLLSVFPHMHLIGTKIESFAVDKNSDTIPLVKVSNWDFDWQGFYSYKHLVKVPDGSKVLGYGLYDNTSANHHNPNNPPQGISVGEATTDEMFLISYQSLAYQPGDENIDLSPMMKLDDPASGIAPLAGQKSVQVSAFPNPNWGSFEINGWELPEGSGETQITVRNLLGEEVASYSQLTENKQPIHIKLNDVENGVYWVVLKNGDQVASQKIVVIQ